MLEHTSLRQSQLFTKTRKEAPKDEVSKNAQLLIRAGYVHKEMAGVYSYLPLGLRVLNKIGAIIREEMNSLGANELLLTTLQDKNVWQTSGRWSDEVVDNWFKTSLKNETELGLGFTHEEPLTALMKDYIHSFRDLPVFVYQIQTKFRNESRAKSGIMRGREFLMKDMYSFSRNAEEHQAFYDKAAHAYTRVFERVGLGDYTYKTFALGGSFSKYSHEFQTITDAGEDIIYTTEGSSAVAGSQKTSQKNSQKIAINKEVLDDAAGAEAVLKELGIERKDLVEKKAVEVGNIFSLGTRFSDAFDLTYVDDAAAKKPVLMGSYGIGLGRLMGTVVEVLSDEAGIVWPESIAPYRVHLIALYDQAGKVKPVADKLFADLASKGVEVLYDDRDCRPGEKFADSDLIGIPLRVVVSEKTLSAGGDGKVEVKSRTEKQAVLKDIKEFVESV